MIVVIDGTRTYRIDQGQRNTVTTTAGVIYCVAHDTSATEYFRCWKSTDYGESSVSALITIGDALSVLQTYDDNHFYRGD